MRVRPWERACICGYLRKNNLLRRSSTGWMHLYWCFLRRVTTAQTVQSNSLGCYRAFA